MLNLFAQGALSAVGALAPWALDQLLNKGVEAEVTPEGVELPAISKERLAAFTKKMRSKRGKNPEEVAKILARGLRKRSKVVGMRKPGLLTPTAGKASTALGIGLTAPFLLPLFSGGGEEEQLAMAMQGQGGEGDLLAMLAGLQDQAEGSRSQLRGDVAESSAAVNAMDRMDMLRARPGTLGLSRASMLEELIRGHEDELSRISYNEPMSLAQAYAMKGLYRDEPQVNLNFGDLL